MPADAAQRRAGLTSAWLIGLILICSVIAIADGLARDFIADEDVLGSSIEYEPHRAVYFFSFISFMLSAAYALQKGIGWSETLLLWLTLCTTAYAKDFSYIRIPGTPIFITDLVLLLVLGPILKVILARKAWRSSYFKLLVAFWLAGVMAFVMGVVSGEELLRSARDMAMVAYSLFLFAALLAVRSWQSVQRVLMFAALGVGLSALNAAAWFLAEPGQRRYLMFGVYALAALVGTLILWANKLVPAWSGFLLVILFSAGLLLANARTTYVALGALLVFILTVGLSGRERNFAARLKLMAQVSTLLLLLMFVILQTHAGAAFVDRAFEELVSGTLSYADDPNAQFRFLAWTEAISRFGADPILGEGFGVPFTFALWDEDVRPHNTYLTVLYKMGLLGFVPFIFLLAQFHWRGWRAVRRSSNRFGAVILYAILIAHVAMCLYGGLNLLLESPFLASVFWICMGLGIRSLQLMSADQNLVKCPAKVVPCPCT